MKCWILIFVCGAFADVSVPTQLPLLVPETLTDLPYGSIEDFDSVTMQARQNEIEGEVQLEAETEAPVSTTTVHFTKLACTGDNYEWNSCGPRCYQTCVFQPRENIRAAKAVCESATSTGCHPGCFCKSGFVRLNDQCILPVECPSEFGDILKLKSNWKLIHSQLDRVEIMKITYTVEQHAR